MIAIMPKKYTDRINLPLVGSEINFTTTNDLLLCKRYERIVFLSTNKNSLHKKPYLEVNKKDVAFENIYIPPTQKWRENGNSSYIEYRSLDFTQTKLMLWINSEDGFTEDRFYIYLLNLKCKNYPELVQKISTKRKIKK